MLAFATACSPGLVKYEAPEAATLPASERAVILGTFFYGVVAGSSDSIYAVDGHRVDSGLLNASRVELAPGLHVVEISYWSFLAMPPGGGASPDLLYEFAADFQAGHVYKLNFGGCSHQQTELGVTAPDGTTRSETVPCRQHNETWRLSQRARQTCPSTATAYWRGIPLAPWTEDLQARRPDVAAGECGVWLYSARGLFAYYAPLLEARIVTSNEESIPGPEFAVMDQVYAHWRLVPGSFVLVVRDIPARTERRLPFQCADHESIFVADVGKDIKGFLGHEGWAPARLKRVDLATWASALLDRFLSAGVSTGTVDEPSDLTCVPLATPKPDQVSQ